MQGKQAVRISEQTTGESSRDTSSIGNKSFQPVLTTITLLVLLLVSFSLEYKVSFCIYMRSLPDYGDQISDILKINADMKFPNTSVILMEKERKI